MRTKISMIAKGKRYGTRHMTAGEPLSVRPAEGRLLKALGVATDAPAAALPPRVTARKSAPSPRAPAPAAAPLMQPLGRDEAPGASVPAEARGDDVAALRDQYERSTGKRADMRWGADRLREAISAGAAGNEQGDPE
jgi:hypothetical protein